MKLNKDINTVSEIKKSRWYENKKSLHYWQSLQKFIEVDEDEKNYRFKLDGITVDEYKNEQTFMDKLKSLGWGSIGKGGFLGHDEYHKTIITKDTP